MLTIKAEIKRSELKVDGTYNVKIRFTLDRKVKRLSTNLFVTQQDLTKSLKFKEDTSIKREIDRLVLYYREQCLKLQLDQNHYSLDEIIEFLNGEQEKQQTIDFIKFSREWIASTTIKGAPNYTTAINALVRFVGKEELDINLITLDFLEQFKAFLIGERDARTKKLMQQGKRVTSNRTLSLYLVSIKKLFNEAKRKFNKKDKNLILIPNSPFEDFKIPKQEATRKRAIPAVLKAGAFRSLSSLYKVEKLHPNSHLYTSGHFLPDFPGRKFRITSSCGFGKKEVKEMLAAEKKANLTVRNFPATVAELRKRLKLAEGGGTYLFATTLADEKKVLIRCQATG